MHRCSWRIQKENLKNLQKIHELVEPSDSSGRGARAEETEKSASHHVLTTRTQTRKNLFVILEPGKDRGADVLSIDNINFDMFQYVQSDLQFSCRFD